MTDLDAKVSFILEADALKRVERRNPIRDGSRRENTAEHSWHLALMAMTLADYSNEPIAVDHVVAMLLVHDLVEIDAGDTFIYDDAAAALKNDAEIAAADRLFVTEPHMRALWDEYEADETAESHFAHTIDRLSPLLLNHATHGALWQQYGITADRVRAKNERIARGSEQLWVLAQRLIDDAVANGWLQDS